MLKDRLKQLRKEKKLTQYEAANALGFSRGQLANYEQGSREPDYKTLEKIAKFYNCSIDYLLGRTEYSITEEEFIQDTKELPMEELLDKYRLTLDGEPVSNEHSEMIKAFIRSLRSYKKK